MTGSAIENTKAIAQWERSWKRRKRVRCYWCANKFTGKVCHADHIIPLASGGAHSLENLCIACSNCNRRKNAKALGDWNATITHPVLNL